MSIKLLNYFSQLFTGHHFDCVVIIIISSCFVIKQAVILCVRAYKQYRRTAPLNYVYELSHVISKDLDGGATEAVGRASGPQYSYATVCSYSS